MLHINPSTLAVLEDNNKKLQDLLYKLQKKKELLEKLLKSREGIAQFQAIAMPLVARVFPELTVNDIVGVQPLSTPTGLANEDYIKKLEEDNKLLSKINADLQDKVNKLEDDCRKYKRDRAILISQVNANNSQVEKDPENTRWVDFTGGNNLDPFKPLKEN
jgi:hypothetical protein